MFGLGDGKAFQLRRAAVCQPDALDRFDDPMQHYVRALELPFVPIMWVDAKQLFQGVPRNIRSDSERERNGDDGGIWWYVAACDDPKSGLNCAKESTFIQLVAMPRLITVRVPHLPGSSCRSGWT